MESGAAPADKPGLGWDWAGLFSTWVELGLDPDAFGRQTPRRLVLILEARGRAAQRRHDERAWHAWHTAALGRIKDFPDLESLLSVASRKEQSAEDIEWALKVWLGEPPQPSE